MTDQRDLAKQVEPVSDEALASLLDYYSDYSKYASDIRRHVFSALSELAALRRPVVQTRPAAGVDEEVERVRNLKLHRFSAEARITPATGRAYAFMAKDGAGDYCDANVVLPAMCTLLSALDQAQREIHDLRCPPDADGDQHACKVCGFPIRYGERHGKCGRFVMALEAEIARLSSPPQERGEIVERQTQRRLWIESTSLGHPSTAFLTVGSLFEDTDTLLQDNIRYRNAHAILLAERDEARGKCESYGNRIDELRHERNVLQKICAERSDRIEQLESAYKLARELLGHLHSRLWDIGLPVNSESRQLVEECISALAAADGRQPPPEKSLIETTKRSPRVVDAGRLRDAADQQRIQITGEMIERAFRSMRECDCFADVGDEALRGRVRGWLRAAMNGDGVADGQQAAIESMEGKHECGQCGLKFSTLAHWSFHEEQCDELRPDQQPGATGDGVEGE